MSNSVSVINYTKMFAFIAGMILLILSMFGTPKVLAQTGCSTTTTPPTTYGQVKQSVSVTTAGTYRVWSRIKAPNTASNSYYFQVDGGCATVVGDSSGIPTNTWHWVNYKNGATSSYVDVTLTAGSHQLTYTGKEADVQLDRVLLLSDTSCVPTGTGDNCANADVVNPTVSVSAPSSGTSVTKGSSVNITASASDNIGVSKVEFYVDGTVVGTDTTAPYSYSWNTSSATVASHSLTARAYDAANNTATSSAVSITVAAGTPVASTPFKGTPAALPGKVEIENYDDGGEGVAYHDTDTTNTLDIGYRESAVDLRQRAEQSNGWTVSYALQDEWMKYTVNVAQAGEYRVVLNAASTGTGGELVMELDGKALAGSTIGVPSQGTWTGFSDSTAVNVTLPAGKHALTVKVSKPGNSTPTPQAGSLDYLDFSLANNTPSDTTKPTVTLDTPANGSTVSLGATVDVTATASDNVGVTKVEFYRGTTLMGTDNSSPYSYSWNTTGLSAGSQTITAKAFDTAGNTTTSAASTVNLATATQPVAGDANGDKRVNGIDYSILASNDGKDYPAADFNKDGTVGAADLAILLSRWTW